MRTSELLLVLLPALATTELVNCKAERSYLQGWGTESFNLRGLGAERSDQRCWGFEDVNHVVVRDIDDDDDDDDDNVDDDTEEDHNTEDDAEGVAKLEAMVNDAAKRVCSTFRASSSKRDVLQQMRKMATLKKVWKIVKRFGKKILQKVKAGGPTILRKIKHLLKTKGKEHTIKFLKKLDRNQDLDQADITETSRDGSSKRDVQQMGKKADFKRKMLDRKREVDQDQEDFSEFKREDLWALIKTKRELSCLTRDERDLIDAVDTLSVVTQLATSESEC